MSNDLALPPDASRALHRGLNEVLFAGTDSDMRASAVLAAQEHVINTVRALGKSADDVLTVLGLIRAKKPSTHSELALVCQVIIAEDRALKNATLARAMERAGKLAAMREHDEISRKSNALAMKHQKALMRYQRKSTRHNGPEVRSSVARNTRWR
jgi:hypothetical protein